MTFHPLVSIIIPVYNGAEYLRDALDSALKQNYPFCEVLVVNDGSDDGGETERIALSYGSAIRYFGKENGGVASALNLGIREMRGDYFSWLSHDDVYLPNKISAQLAFLEKNNFSSAAVYSDFFMVDSAGRKIRAVRLPDTPPHLFFRQLYLTGGLQGCTLLIPRQALLESGLFSEDLPTTQDYDLWFRMCRTIPFVHLAETLLLSRLHNKQGSRAPKHKEEQRELYQRYFSAFMEQEKDAAMMGQGVSGRLALMREFFALGRVDCAGMLVNYETEKESREILEKEYAALSGSYRIRRTARAVLHVFRPVWEYMPDSIRTPLRRLKAGWIRRRGVLP